MSDWPERGTFQGTEGGVISTATVLAGLSITGSAGAAWVGDELAVLVPFRVPATVTAYKMVVGAGATAAGNFDVGIYDRFGNRLVSTGTTAKGSSVEHALDITDTQLGRGVYYMAMSADGLDNYILLTATGTALVSTQKMRLYGVLNVATSFPLPDPITLAAATVGAVPYIAVYLRPA